MNIQETVAVAGVLTAFLTATVALIGLRWNKQAAEAKDAEISSLKSQISVLESQSPASLSTQFAALRNAMEQEILDLRKQLEISNRLLAEKTAEVSADKRAAADIMGRARLLFDISTAELELRRLRATIFWYSPEPRDFGEATDSVWSFYVGAMRLIVPNAQAAVEVAAASDEWLGDYGIMPLIIAMSYDHVREQAAEIASELIDGLAKTWRASEAGFWRKILARADRGEVFASLQLPVDDLVLFIRAKEQDDEARSSSED
jgi:hypothetical protein